jgi:hypothetical protein
VAFRLAQILCFAIPRREAGVYFSPWTQPDPQARRQEEVSSQAQALDLRDRDLNLSDRYFVYQN